VVVGVHWICHDGKFALRHVFCILKVVHVTFLYDTRKPRF
jgi:hypothetical protein